MLKTILLALACISWGIGAFHAYLNRPTKIDFLQLGLMFAGIALWFA